MNRAGWPYDVLRLQCRDQCRSVDPQAGEFLHREFDEDPLVLRPQQFDFRYVRHQEQLRADILDAITQFAMRETVARKAVDDPERIAEIVVEAGPNNSCRKRVADISDILANLIPGVSNLLCVRAALQVDKDRRNAGTREAAQKIQVRRFLQFALKPLGYLLERLFDGRSRPGCLYDHGLDDEGRIFAAAKSEIGQDAGDDGNDHDVGDERAVFERPFGEIDHGSDPSRRIFWPG